MANQRITQHSYWLGDSADALFTHVYGTENRRQPILLVHPLGPEYMHCHASQRQLAMALAESGYPVWTFDLPGYGNSAQSLPLESGVKAWQNAIQIQCDHIQQLTNQPPMVIALRGSALLLNKIAQQVAALVLWYPQGQGVQLIRDWGMIDQAMPDTDADENLMTAGGYPLFHSDVKALEAIKLSALSMPTETPLLVLHTPATRTPAFIKKLISPLADGTAFASDCLSRMSRAAERSEVARADIEHIVHWVQERFNQLVGSSFELPDSGLTLTTCRERAVRFGRDKLFGVLTTPGTGTNDVKSCVIIANTGGGHHAGPNGLHSQLARHYALAGIACLRMDLRHLGLSGVASEQNRNHAYCDTAAEDIQQAGQWLVSEGFQRLQLFGICSGAYSAFSAARNQALPLDSLVLVNTNTYYWRVGDDPTQPNTIEHHQNRSYYKDQAADSSAWLSLLTTPSKWLKVTKTVASMVNATVINAVKAATTRETELEKDFNNVMTKGARIALYFTENEPGVGVLQEQASRLVSNLRDDSRFTLATDQPGDHTFTSMAAREALINYAVTISQGSQTTASEAPITNVSATADTLIH